MQRKQFIGLSFLSLFALLSKKVFGETTTIQPMATQIKNYLICEGIDELHYFDLSPFYANWWAEVVGSLPTGIDSLQDADTASVVGFSVDYSTLATGINTVTIEGFEQTSAGDSIGQFTLVFEKAATCSSEQTVTCCGGAINLRWLGREGAIKEWVFPGVREYDVRIGDANTFKNSDYQLQYSERKDIYTGKSISTGNISKAQADFLDELRYSIQVWEWDGTTATPIVVNNDSFFKYRSKDKLYDITIRYVVAEQIQVQTQ